MIGKLDDASVLMLSEKGHYGYIKILDSNDDGIEVFYLAICRYDITDALYLFLCDKCMSVEQDLVFNYLDEAISEAQARSQDAIVWNYAKAGI